MPNNKKPHMLRLYSLGFRVYSLGLCTRSFCRSFCPLARLHVFTTGLVEEEGEWAQLSRDLACDAGLFFTDCHGDRGDLHSEYLQKFLSFSPLS